MRVFIIVLIKALQYCKQNKIQIFSNHSIYKHIPSENILTI